MKQNKIMYRIFLIVTVFCLAFGNGRSMAQDKAVDFILVEKSARNMVLKNKGETLRQYKISLGGNPVGPKEREGDQKTPEGTYIIESHNPRSSYHLSLRISYPNQEQRVIAQKNGYSPGGDIMIHGYPNWVVNKIFDVVHRNFDWTEGCIAVTDAEIEEIYDLVKDGTPIEIRP